MICQKDRFGRIVPLLVAQTLGAFNDNAVKAFLPVLAAFYFGKESMDQINQWASLLLILPFILFAPLAGWVSDRFSKRRVIGVSLFSQLLALSVILLGISFQSLFVALIGFFLLSTQSTFLSPAKKGILKEIVGYEKLGKAVGWMEMLCVVGILAGAFTGAVLFDQFVGARSGWGAAQQIVWIVLALAFLSWLINLPTPATAVIHKTPFCTNLLFGHFHDLKNLLGNPRLRWAALGDACFWAVGGFFYLVLVRLSGEVIDGKVGMGSLYGYWFLLLGVGIMAGALFAAYLNKGRVEIGLSPLGLLGMTFSLAGVYFFPALGRMFEVCCTCLGFFGALFFVPLNGYLQDRAEPRERGRVLAASNLLTQLGGVLLIGFHVWLANGFGLGAKLEILILLFPLGFLAVLVTIVLFEDLIRSFFHMFLRVFYRIEIRGMRNFPEREGALIVSNHLSYADPLFIGAAFPRKVRYLAHRELSRSWLMKAVFRLTETLTVSSAGSLTSVKQSIKRLGEGTPLCLFAEGGISRIGITLPFMRGSILLAKSARVPIVPTYLDGVWGSVYSNQGGCFFKKLPQSFPYRVSVWVGHPIQSEQATPESVRQAVLELGRESFNQRLENPEKMCRNLRKQIFRSSSDILFKDRNGCEISRSQFLGKINSCRELSEPYGEWIQEVQDVLNKRDASKILPWINWMRLKQTNLIDHPKLRICTGDKTWMDQWFPWFPLLSGFGFEQNEDGSWQTISNDESSAFHRVDGLATPQNGLVALQFPDVTDAQMIQQGTKKGAWGRMLPGLSYYIKDGEFVLNGMKDPEILPQICLDKDGFLINSVN
jgi:acyl-[acyl-carrier-protein]-phospholipid O-acyltransferase/long-chain-fatty-acid--[acyl-carrier-protein] ligase